MAFVLDKHKKPLDPCEDWRAWKLLNSGRAVLDKCFPLTIRLKDRLARDSVTHDLRISFDPGTKHVGVSVSLEAEKGEKAVQLIKLELRGDQIKMRLDKRSMHRRRRRTANLRGRKMRCDRSKPKGWLSPCNRHRVEAIYNLACKLSKLCNISIINVETARFDTQKMENPDIKGIQYQHGELCGFEIKQYLLEKYGYQCVYCGAKGVPLTVDHVIPTSRNGSNRVSNLVIACFKCNQAKNNRPLEEFVTDQTKLEEIRSQLKEPLRDAGNMNAIRYRIVEKLRTRFNVTTSTAAQTKFNRNKYNIPKHHSLDALFSGEPRKIRNWRKLNVLVITSMGRGVRQRMNPDKYGFPVGHKPRKKSFFGFQTGDMVTADVPKGKKRGHYMGRVICRESGYFDIKCGKIRITGINHKYCKVLQRNDGYQYSIVPLWDEIRAPSPASRRGASAQ